MNDLSGYRRFVKRQPIVRRNARGGFFEVSTVQQKGFRTTEGSHKKSNNVVEKSQQIDLHKHRNTGLTEYFLIPTKPPTPPPPITDNGNNDNNFSTMSQP